MNKQRLHDAETDFLALFPGGFSNPVMLLECKKHQVAKRSEQAQELFSPERFAHPQQVA